MKRNKSFLQALNIKKLRRICLRFQLLLFAILLSGALMAQQNEEKISLIGYVTSDTGEPLTGVNVVVKGTLNGSITDFEGNYNILVSPSDTLEFRFIGFKPKEVAVQGRSLINVRMEPKVGDLEEVVIVGYGEVKRANLLGSVASMDAVEIQDIPATSLTSLFEGRLAGVHVQPAQPSGLPGSSNRVIVRIGETTFGLAGGTFKNPQPLYIIDGVEVTQSEFDVLDPSEVDNISVLKDASAAVYGSKGANGVVLIKTKRGREGKLIVTYNGSYGISDATQQTDMLSAYDQARMLNAINRMNPGYDEISIAELDEMKNLDYNWLDEAWKLSSIARHSVNVQGGNESVKYYAGGNYVYETGNFNNLDVKRYSYRLGLDLKILEGLTSNITLNFDNKDRKIPYVNGEQETFADLFKNLLLAPKWKPSHINGYPVGNNVKYNGLAQFNSNGFRKGQAKGSRVSIRLNYELPWVKGLSISANFSQRETNSYGKQYRVPYNIYTFEGRDDTQLLLSEKIVGTKTVDGDNSLISESFSYGKNYQLNTSIQYSRKIEKHNISAFINYEQSESEGLGFDATSYMMQIANLELQQAFEYENAKAESSLSESGRVAGIGRFNYGYANKYLLETAFRFEGTTKFAPGERGGLFPSLAIGWVISEESFFKDNLAFIDFLKTRYSFGITGFPAVGDYEYRYSFAPSSGSSYLFGNGYIGSAMSYAGKTDVVGTGVSWEKSRMNNFGVDMKFFDSKLSLTVDAFNNFQYDILEQITPTLPGPTGIKTMPSQNNGKMKSWGYDASLAYRGKISRDFTWNLRANFAFATNRVIEKVIDPMYDNPLDYHYPIGRSTYSSEGNPEEGYITNGIIRTQEQLDAINAEWNQKWGEDYRPFNMAKAGVGMLFYQDVGRAGNTAIGEPKIILEPDGKVDASDVVYIEKVNDHLVIKNLLPTSTNLGFKWKSFSLSSLWTFAWGVNSKMVDKLALSAPTKYENAPAFWADFYSETNIDAEYPDPLYERYNAYKSSFWMRDLYSVRLHTLNVSYTLPDKTCKAIGMSSIRVYLTGKNIWTPISTFDYKEDAIARFNTYPFLKTISFGINARL